MPMLSCAACGSVAERLNAPVLKTGVGKPIVSSNLTGPASCSGRFLVCQTSSSSMAFFKLPNVADPVQLSILR